MRFLYLAVLLVSLGCMVLMDHRWRLFLFADARRAVSVLAAGIAFFLLVDVAAIVLGFYGRGQGESLSGIEVAPHLPVEELVFVTFLCHLTMVAYGLGGRLLDRRAPERRR